MRPNLFNFDNFPVVGNETVSEQNSPSKQKIKELSFPVGDCNGFFEYLQGRLKEIRNSEEAKISDILHDLPTCKLVLRKSNILGEYFSDLKHIEYYKQTCEVLEITKIHERFHAKHHLTLDNDGDIWEDFATVDSFYKELLAQLFTYIYIRDNESQLLPTFENLNHNQPLIYQTFKIFGWNYTELEAENLYWLIRENKSSILIKALKKIEKIVTCKTTNNSKVMAPSVYVFKRHVSPNLISKLINEPLYHNHLLPDILKGDVFLAIRDNRIDFYHNGGKLFAYDDQGGFHTHIKYAAVIDNYNQNYLTEKELYKCKIISDFSSNYSRIKENCSLFSGIEASGVSYLYKNYSYLTKSNKVVLDIEISFKSDDPNKAQDRIDILIYDTIKRKLKFVEAKHYSNSEIWSTGVPKVISQIARYENQIKAKKQDIINNYNMYIDNVNALFKINLPYIIDIDEKVILTILGFDKNQKNGRLEGLIRTSSAYKNVELYLKGNPKDLYINNIRNIKH